MIGSILIIEDEQLLARNMKIYLQRKGLNVVTSGTLVDGLELYNKEHPDIVLIDHNLPDGTGLEIITEIRKRDRATKLVMITAHGSIDVAVAAMKAGANDYLTKPVSLDEVAILVEKMLNEAKLEGSLSYFRKKQSATSGLARIIGTSGPMTELRQRIQMLLTAERNAGAGALTQAGPPVLIMGETGTGKELIARALHFDGPRAEQPFIEVNCATLPEQLIESELFGHERGAFTGAMEKKLGLFVAADGGTLFLDEVGELPQQQQAKLLKVIEEKVVRPLGSVRDRPINVRIIAATNAALEERSRTGDYRSDLLYRLNTITLHAPPLRERGADVILIAETFIQHFQKQYGRMALRLTGEAKAALMRHSWPGNVRELRNVIEQACLMALGETIHETDLHLRMVPAEVKAVPQSASEANHLGDVEKSLIIDALKQHHGNVTLASRKLGISRDTLRYRMEKHGFRREDYM